MSANGSVSGIVWAHENTGTAVLHAYDATNLTRELYNSDQAAKARDNIGPATRFSIPTIANGKVYVATQTELDAFGLLQ